MTPYAPPVDYSHLKPVEVHPEMLHPLLRPLARSGGVLRWMHVGGEPDGLYLFCIAGRAFRVVWDGMQYRPVDPLNAGTKRRNPFLWSLIVDALLRRITGKGGGA